MMAAIAAGKPGRRMRMIIAVGVALLTTQAYGQSRGGSDSGPFQGLSGSWTGTGTVSLSDGAEERIRCRAQYAVGTGGNVLRQNLRCASASYRFELSSEVLHRAGTLSGNWSESIRNTGGTVSGSVSGNGSIQAVASGAGFSATISVTTRGDRQSVQLQYRGQDVTRVSISLRRA